MKKLLLIMSIATICIAQTKVDSVEVQQLQSQLSQTAQTIVTIQSEIYEREKRLKDLYTSYSYLTDIIKLKSELIEVRKKEKK